MLLDDELTAAMQAVYAAFSRYPTPQSIDASPVYSGEDFLKPLVAAPLRELTCEQVGRYAGKALTTVGRLDDYKHFLPRLLEHVVNERCAFVGLGPDEFANRLLYGGWPSWPHDERQTILTVFRLASRQSAQDEQHIWREALTLLHQ